MAVRIRKPRGGRRTASISMAPMIDMVFLLLVFFMTASAMSQAGNKLEVQLPSSLESEVPKDLSDRLIVSVAADGSVYVGRSEIDDAELRETLAEFRERFPQAKLSIRADRGARFRDIKRVMALATEAGLENYLYATLQGSD